ncbi:hypothetical protein LTR37_003209 [Vermiconidia calcicola]|uniref:Uncharacterized protein n=1 Tax=Vermiconidia calcicola TaxID=1690605 RepID=A0ACC3NRU2_9PEZI|nr:hypothetical protein LTR37_003209 [Vermiconidia calcicola]
MHGIDTTPRSHPNQAWIEQLLADTPSPTPVKHKFTLETPSLIVDASSTEHVLRGTKSFTARSFRSRASGNSLRVPSSNKENRSTTDAENSRQSSGQLAPSTGPVLGEIAPNNQILRPAGPLKFRPSPTPSLKKKKAEAIVKAHGSPQHLRVTAGGRIVPSEQSPLCHPRYGYSAIKANGGLVKFAPNHPLGKAQWTQATQNGFVAQDVNGRLCQIVDGTILPLNEVDGALRLYVPAPNLNISSRGSSFGPPAHGRFNTNGAQQRATSVSKPMVSADPPLPAQTNALELEYSKLEHELRELDKTEALHGRTMNKTAKDALIGKRRELVVTLDNIRKAIKSIKTAPPPEAPTSPRAMRGQQSMSPPTNRLPAFLQHRAQQSNEMPMQPVPPAFNHLFGLAQAQQFGGQYGFGPTPSPDMAFSHPFAAPPAAMFVPPPAFDGSVAPPFAPFAEPMPNVISASQPVQPVSADVDPADADCQLPQNDGARSIRDLQKVGSPRQSRALDIKAPEPKPSAALKSTLNPMSPAYKPGTGVLKAAGNASRPAAKPVRERVPTPLSPLHQLRPSAAANNAARDSVDTISPTKKSPHLHSSSISSFETADFFPRNTREYSTRKYASPDQSEDKGNMSPVRSVDNAEGSPATPLSDPSEPFVPKAAGYKAPAPPPGTPVSKSTTSDKPQLPIQITTETRHLDFGAVPDRQTHNLSPKSRRQDFLFVEENPSQWSTEASSSPVRHHSSHEETAVTSSTADTIDFTEASTEWIEGYRAGLARKPVGSDRQGEFLDGYCAGLLKSKPVNIGPSTGSPLKPTSRRPSPGLVQSRSSSRLQADRREGTVPVRPPFENSLQSMDTLKEAILAPQNEDAILTPSAEGPANEHPYNLGAWAKSHGTATSVESLAGSRGEGVSGFPFPDRNSLTLSQQRIVSGNHSASKQQTAQSHASTTAPEPTMRPMSISSELSAEEAPQMMASFSTAAHSVNQSSSNNASNRISSMTSIDSNLYRQYPGHRVFSPHLEWKSASSIAQAAGLAAGHFAQAQTDGAPNAQQQPPPTTSNQVMESHSRFKEGSLDGITNPPNSPQLASPPMSPSLPPKDSPSRDSRKKDSPGKGNSPAKVKFEHIAEKVGIKVAVGKKQDDGSPNSPPGKRRWRDVWLGGSRNNMSKDEGTPAPLT